MNWNLFFTEIAKVIFSLAGIGVVAGIAFGINYWRKKNPKSFDEMLVIAKTIANYIKGFVSAHPESKILAQEIVDMFVKKIVSLNKYITTEEVTALFESIVKELANDLGMNISNFVGIEIDVQKTKYSIKHDDKKCGFVLKK